MERIIQDLQQGTQAWDEFRLNHHGASEAAPMLGLSQNVTRSELLHMKHTGVAKEFSDWVQANILERGHEIEDLTRPFIEELIGDELYPSVWSYGQLSASCDGLTMDGKTAFECKQWNKALADSVRNGILPDEHMPQCQQIMLVTGAERVIFTVSDGTPDGYLFIEVKPSAEWIARILNGWRQFDEDLANYKPPEVIPAVVATPTLALPAVSIQVNGSIALKSNLDVFGEKLKAFIAGINLKPSNDQEFADAESHCKTLQEAQDRLEAAEASALAQTATVDEMRRTVALYVDLARTNRLMLEKLVKSRKEEIRQGMVTKAFHALQEHWSGLNKRLGKPYMPALAANFAGVIKGLRTIASLRDAVDTELARLKIEANAIADRIGLNLNTLRELAADHEDLFADTATIVLKENDDFTTLVKMRIAEHKAKEQKRLDDEREKIRQEEAAKLQAAQDMAAKDAVDKALFDMPQRAPVGGGAKTVKRPTDREMVIVLAQHYNVTTAKVVEWLSTLDLKSANKRVAAKTAA